MQPVRSTVQDTPTPTTETILINLEDLNTWCTELTSKYSSIIADVKIAFINKNSAVITNKTNVIHLAAHLSKSHNESTSQTFFDNLQRVVERTLLNINTIRSLFGLADNAELISCELPPPSEEYTIEETHNGLQQVCFLTFNDEKKICYKPRDMRGEAAIFGNAPDSYFSNLNRLLIGMYESRILNNQQQLATLQYMIPMQDSDQFGFMEYVEDKTTDLINQMKQPDLHKDNLAYTFTNIGILESVCRHCRIIDLHSENVMAISILSVHGQSVPVIIDGELYEDIFRNDFIIRSKIIATCHNVQGNFEDQQISSLCKKISNGTFTIQEIQKLLDALESKELLADGDEIEDLITNLSVYPNLVKEMTSLLNNVYGYVGGKILMRQPLKNRPAFEEAFTKGMEMGNRITTSIPQSLSYQIGVKALIPDNCKRRCALIPTSELKKMSLLTGQDCGSYANKIINYIGKCFTNFSFEISVKFVEEALRELRLPIDIPVFYLSRDNSKLFLGKYLIGEVKKRET